MVDRRRGRRTKRLTCTVCGDLVIEPDLREHLVMHHPNARGMDWEDVRNVFVVPPPQDGGTE